MKAILVYDGRGGIFVPTEMGVPREDQLQGTDAERLSELAGRICYDSLGSGRPSFTVLHDDGLPNSYEVEGYHDHILKVGHGSVLEHFNFTVALPISLESIAPMLLNRPGVWATTDKYRCRVTLNLRAAVEWRQWSDGVAGWHESRLAKMLEGWLCGAAHVLAPHIVKSEYIFESVDPVHDEERWVSMYLAGSRGFSHEMVRHGDFTAISQRSTRYVDESKSPWIEHPLIQKFCDDMRVKHAGDCAMLAIIEADNPVISEARSQYKNCAASLEEWLVGRGVDKLSARKQARGAARGYLGNALQTEMIFSASVAQWKRILRQRACAAADAEIREIACQALSQLKESRYGDRFNQFELRPSPDGIGQIAIEV